MQIYDRLGDLIHERGFVPDVESKLGPKNADMLAHLLLPDGFCAYQNQLLFALRDAGCHGSLEE